jgi:hypothetical protein
MPGPMAQVREAYLNPVFVYAARPPRLDADRRLALYLRVSLPKCRQRLHDLNIHLPPLHAVWIRDMTTLDFSVKLPNHPTRAAIYSNEAAAAAVMFPTVAPYLARLQATTGTGAPPRECPFRLHTAVCCAPLVEHPTFRCATHASPCGCQCARTHAIQAAEQRRVTLSGLFGRQG